jgi:hypothetical protein
MAQATGLEIDQDLEFQRRSWIVQRVGWAIMLALLVAGGLGLLGSGPLSARTASIPGLMRVDYQRFGRYQTSESLTIELEPQATAGGVVRLGIDRHYLEGSKIESIVPPVERVEGLGDRLVHVFRMAQPGVPLRVTLRRQPEQFGSIRGRIVLEGGSDVAGRTISFQQFVYP